MGRSIISSNTIHLNYLRKANRELENGPIGLAEALRLSERVLAENPLHHIAVPLKVRALWGLNRHDEALSSVSSLAIEYPDVYELSVLRAHCLYKMGRIRRAAKGYVQALRIRPQALDGLYMLATTLEDLGKKKRALDTWETILQNPLGYPLLQDMGSKLLEEGNNDRAMERLEALIERRPGDAHLIKIKDDIARSEYDLTAALAQACEA